MEKVILAFSSGLDTSVCIKLLQEKYNMEVITVCVDVGQPEKEVERLVELLMRSAFQSITLSMQRTNLPQIIYLKL